MRWVLLAVTCLGLAGCGSEEQRAAAQSKPAATQAPDPRATTELEIRQAANAYLKAYARGDWTGVCDTLVPSERRYFDERGGRCEHVFRQRDPIMRLYAVEEDGAWGIARSKKRREKTGPA